MSLRQLCDEIQRVRQQLGRTPVLSVPQQFSLHNAFLIDLCSQLLVGIAAADHPANVVASGPAADAEAGESSLQVRLDWLREGGRFLSILADPWTRMRAARINAALQSQHHAAQVQVTSTIGRPSTTGQTLVVGLADAPSELPKWAHPIHLLGSSRSSMNLQWDG